ncbi:DUF445 family protein [Flagellatimonas centrodinii]|uniref:DUF445 family protein n=1 Tax=Flagellatimonas centrodinii TaxID=2806210 RepID=UPI001FFC8AD0|nr:DUF445 family protein [Flagellatimonas centrodinii]ULQ46422.1 DUF445 family protein [Flagellatimonas centrodinii]
MQAVIDLLGTIAHELADKPLLYAALPVMAAVVGYVTNVLAIKMMFLPIRFVGIPPYLGWQGIIPRKSGKMASIAVDTITQHLITVEEIFSRIDPERLARELEGPMTAAVEDIADEVMNEHHPTLWVSLPAVIRRRLLNNLKAEVPAVVRDITRDVRRNVHEVFNLKDMVVSKLIRERTLINRIFLETGHAEFKFIGRSGLYFGFLFGVVQTLIFTIFQTPWQLPVAGLLVGYATNWIALHLIFNPRDPVKLGPVTFQGLFMKRQKEVARDYGNLVADEILTPANIIESILKGPQADRVVALIQRHAQQAIDAEIGLARRFVPLTVGSEGYRVAKTAAVRQIIERLPMNLRRVESYATDAMDIRNTLITRLQALPPDDFEAMLRPAFKEDEWLLIAVGAALGMLVGVGQMFLPGVG